MAKKAKISLTKSDIHKDAMIESLSKCLGVVTTACKKVGITRETHYHWFNTDEGYKNRVMDIKNIAIDFVESKMFAAINNGDSSLTKYYLSTQGKSRGYVEKMEVDNQVTMVKPVIIDWGAPE
jgi:hypothetical protein